MSSAPALGLALFPYPISPVHGILKRMICALEHSWAWGCAQVCAGVGCC